MPSGTAAELREELTASVRRHIMSEVYMATLLLDIGNPDFALKRCLTASSFLADSTPRSSPPSPAESTSGSAMRTSSGRSASDWKDRRT